MAMQWLARIDPSAISRKVNQGKFVTTHNLYADSIHPIRSHVRCTCSGVF
ncbi:MAG: hypothetical protein COA63_013070 [Methylophaga sp.]|nr:hypothetical protein [Methylophaga sp.]